MRASGLLAGLVASAALLAGCAPGESSVPTPPPAEPTERMPGEGTPCVAEEAQKFLGQKASQSVGSQIISATGARIFQWVPPDTAVTKDYRLDRVRVSYDAALLITSIRCG